MTGCSRVIPPNAEFVIVVPLNRMPRKDEYPQHQVDGKYFYFPPHVHAWQKCGLSDSKEYLTLCESCARRGGYLW